MKSQLNNKKVWLNKGKITKSSMTFNENKPNFKNITIGVSLFKTGKYEILTAWRSKNQTQFKPNLSRIKANSNPIHGMAKFALSSFLTSKYVRLGTLPGKKTNPNKPNFETYPEQYVFIVKYQRLFLF